MSSRVPTFATPPKPQRSALHNFELPSDLEWSTKRERSNKPIRKPRVPKPYLLDFLHGNFSKPSSGSSSLGLSPKPSMQSTDDSSPYNLVVGLSCVQRTSSPLRFKILSSGSATQVPSPLRPSKTTEPGSSSNSKGVSIQENKDKQVKADEKSKGGSRDKKKNDGKEKKKKKQIEKKEPNQESQVDMKLPKFSTQLTPREIAEDLFAMTGGRTIRKPKKRPKYVQREVEQVTPGIWLESIEPERYKVDEDIRKDK